MKVITRLILLFLTSAFFIHCSKGDNTETSTINPTPTQTTTEYTLSISAGNGGIVSSSGGTYESGTQVTVTASPNPGYIFSSWSNGETQNQLTIIINSNLNITANFNPLSYPLRMNIQEFTRSSGNNPIFWEGEIYDYNNDNSPDFLAVNNGNGNLEFYTGTPNEFNQVQQFTLFDSVDIIETVNVQESDSLNRSHSILTDLDNDGTDEIITNLQGEWYDAPNFNNGDWNNDGIPNGFFHGGMYIINNGQVVEFDSIPSQKFGSIFSIDINNDGYNDILDALPANYYNSDINIYFNDGTGNLNSPINANYIRRDAGNWSDMIYIDANNDGHKDLVSAWKFLEINYGTANPEIYNYEKIEYTGPIIENDCLGLYQPLSGNPNIPFHEQILVVDIDGDGIKEILASIGYDSCNKNKSVLMYKYNGSNYILDTQSGFYIENYYTGNTLKFISKDYDEDGDQDIFTLFFYSDPGCNSFSQLNYDAIAVNGFFWKNDNGALVKTEYEFCQ
tara:strand:+ start:122 stop:1636 length:1515 start_codon:yes stop_codon:yes gene_type:complete